jgi:hypothetical protein
MPKAFSHGLSRKLFTLAVLIGCLIFLYAGQGVKATDADCCISEYNSCNAQCGIICDASGCHTDYNCYMACNNTFANCSSPQGQCQNPPQQPQTPCQGCLDNCDQMHQDCLAAGTQTPQQCAYMSFRCRQRCNLYCIY